MRNITHYKRTKSLALYSDLILYPGKRFVIYYDKNSWNFTKLGHIDNITQNVLESILGDGDVTANLSLEK